MQIADLVNMVVIQFVGEVNLKPIDFDLYNLTTITADAFWSKDELPVLSW